MRTRLRIVISLFVLLAGSEPSSAAQESEEPFQLTCADGFVVDGMIRLPASGETDQVEKVIILLHGSGPQSMDLDLTAVTKQGKQNLLFKEISDALSNAGFAVVRYNKRSYQLDLKGQEDPAFLDSKTIQTFAKNPLKFFVSDAMDSVRFVKERFPGADIFLLGLSEGTSVALQVAHQMSEIKGVALLGFYAVSVDILVFEQLVYRPLNLFEQVDASGDDEVDGTELKAETPAAALLRSQMAVIDIDADGKISRLEFQAVGLSNLLVRDLMAAFREQEARYPRPSDILASASFKVAFFQGLWDNQTPAYNTKAVELVAKQVWKKENFRFFYFPKLGHALDARASYDDLQYDTIAPEAKAKLAGELAKFF
ncbi:MAG: hypothetical protein AAGC60_13645 [Acidobacteriota bacterium]